VTLYKVLLQRRIGIILDYNSLKQTRDVVSTKATDFERLSSWDQYRARQDINRYAILDLSLNLAYHLLPLEAIQG
jgi:hypothetical protein